VSIQFPQRLTKLSDNAWVVLQNNLDYLADLFDKFTGKQTKGTSTITNGNTFVDVNFSSPITNPAVVVTPVADPGGRVWISNRTSGGFRINQGVAAPVGGVAYDWIAKGA
jgi:hypothetical protein